MKSIAKLILLLALTPLCSFATAPGGALPQGFNFDGILTDNLGNPVTVATPMRFTIIDSSGSCMLYEEQQSVTPDTTGSFSVVVGSDQGNAKRASTNDPGHPWASIFRNSSSLGVTAVCPSGFNPTPGAIRRLRVSVNNIALPDITMNSVPSATVAETLQHLKPSDLIQTRTDSGYALTQANVENIFLGTNYSILTNLLAGGFMPAAPTASVDFNGQRIINVSAPTGANDATNKSYVDGLNASVGGRTTNLTGVGAGLGGGKTLVWDQSANGWTTGNPSDPTKLPLVGGTMTGAIDMGSQNLLNSGYISMMPLKTLQVSNVPTASEATLITGFSGADKGKMWFDSTADVLRLWNGSAAVNVGGGGAGISAIGGDVTGTGPGLAMSVITANAVTNTKLADNSVTSAKLNNAGIAINRLVATDATTGNSLTYMSCSANGEILQWSTATGWQCTASALGSIANNGNSLGTAMTVGTNDGFELRFKTSNAVGMTMSTAGYLGIGDVAPAYRLSVTGTGPTAYSSSSGSLSLPQDAPQFARIANTQPLDNAGTFLTFENKNTATQTNLAYIGSTSNGAGYAPAIVFGQRTGAAAYSERMRIDNNGNLGINISSASHTLTVNGAARIVPTALPAGSSPGVLTVDSGDANKLKFHNGTTWITLSASAGDFMSNGSIPMAGNMSMGGNVLYGNNTASGNLTLDSTSHATKGKVLLNPSGGFVGIGTATPATSLHIESSNYGFRHSNAGLVWNTFLGSGVANIGTESNHPMAFSTNQTIKMTLMPNGNVGIGTSIPTRLLDVAGPMRLMPAAMPGSPTAGDIVIDSTDANKFKYFNGTTWATVGTGAGDFLANGTVAMTGQLKAFAGVVGTPGISFSGDPDTGFYNLGTNEIYMAMNGALKYKFLSTQMESPNTGSFLMPVGSGTALGPAYSFSGNANTGMFQPATNMVAFSTNTVERMRIDAGGNVGIGTSTPSEILDVNGVVKAMAGFVSSGGGGTVGAGCSIAGKFGYNGTIQNLTICDGSIWKAAGTGDFKADGSVAMTGPIRAVTTGAASPGHSFVGDTDTGMFSSTADTLGFATGGSQRILIMPGGKVGIGTTANTYQLEVGGDMAVNGVKVGKGGASMSDNVAVGDQALNVNSSGNQNTAVGRYAAAANTNGVGNTAFGWQALAGNVTTSGNTAVGKNALLNGSGRNNTAIGLNAGTAMASGAANTLVGYSAGAGLNTGNANTFVGPSSGSQVTSGSGNVIIGSHQGTSTMSNTILLSDGSGIERFRITSTGNVGIGTSTPSSPLHVLQNLNSLVAINIENKSSAANAGAGLLATNDLGSMSSLSILSSTYNAGPGAYSADTAVLDSYGTGGISLLANTGKIQFYAGGAGPANQRVVIMPNGSVGIGNSSPAARLHVEGAIVSSEKILASGAGIDMAAANQWVLQNVGGNVITVNNMVAGGQYRVLVEDAASRTYTFSGCSSSYFNPVNGATAASTKTKYTITYSTGGKCYIDWQSGYQ